jgi:hypothetical protein
MRLKVFLTLSTAAMMILGFFAQTSIAQAHNHSHHKCDGTHHHKTYTAKRSHYARAKYRRTNKRYQKWQTIAYVQAKNMARAKARLYKDVTPQQKLELKNIKLQEKLTIARLKALKRAQKITLRAELLAEKTNKQNIKKALDDYLKASLDLMTARTEFFLKKRDIFTTETQKKYYTMLWIQYKKAHKKAQKEAKKAIKHKYLMGKFYRQKKSHKKSHKATAQHKCQHATTGQHKCQHATTGQHKCQHATTGQHKCQHATTGQHKCQHASKDKAHRHTHQGRGHHQGHHAHQGRGHHQGHHAHQGRGHHQGHHAHQGRGHHQGHYAHQGRGHHQGHHAHCGCGHHHRYHHAHCGCGHHQYKGHYYKYRRTSHYKSKRRYSSRTKKQARKFWKSLSAEQTKARYRLGYEKRRVMMPLNAALKFEKALYLSYLMDLNIQSSEIKTQIAKIIEAKGAIKAAKIDFHLAFYNTLDAKQRVDYGFLKMNSWRKQKRIYRLARKYIRFYTRIVKQKTCYYLKKIKAKDQRSETTEQAKEPPTASPETKETQKLKDVPIIEIKPPADKETPKPMIQPPAAPDTSTPQPKQEPAKIIP